MRLLLDTNVFVDLATDRDSINRDVLEMLDDYDNQLYISTESLRELIVLYRNKNLLRKEWKNEEEMLRSIEDRFYLQILPLNKEHMMTYARMELNEAEGHKDPSDHVIIAHAMTEKLTLISSDTRFPFYQKQGLKLVQNN